MAIKTEHIISVNFSILKNDKKTKKIETIDVMWLYTHLMDYKIAAEKLLKHNSGVLTVSSLGFQAAMEMTQEVNQTITNQIKPIDVVLAQIIDPEGQVFEESELIEKFGFPKDHIQGIE